MNPIRMCVCCREHLDKNYLVRIVRSPEGNVSINQKSDGRGAYLCKKSECFKRITKAKLLDKHLKIRVNQEIYDRLESFCDK